MARRKATHRGVMEALESRRLLSAGLATPTFIAMPLTESQVGSITGSPTVSGSGTISSPFTPSEIDKAYGVNDISFDGVVGNGAGQTIAIIDAFNDPDIVPDVATFDSTYDLQAFNVSGGPTLQVLSQTGTTNLPRNAQAGGWDVEESLDVEWAHAIAPDANIILYEASNEGGGLYTAIDTAKENSAVSVISMSWSGPEFYNEASYDSEYFTTPAGHQGITFLAATGDNGEPSGYPAYSPNVVAVGGTSLTINSNGSYGGETGWDDSGGGISQYEPLPGYQDNLDGVNGSSTTNRNVPDVSIDANPDTGVDVYDSYDGGWMEIGGTSLATPMWAGLIAIADQGLALRGVGTLNGATQTLRDLYALPSTDFHQITSGNNGYAAGAGYNLVTGLGSPIANLLVPALAGYNSSASVSSDWQVITPGGATGDFNGSGTSDILLENSSTGQVGAWMMNGGAVSSWVNMGTVPSGWKVEFLGDFTGNGTTDLLLQNTSTGQIGSWIISNGQVSSWSNMGMLPTGWTIKEASDFTGDGTDDLLLQNSSTGQLGIWLVSNAQISGWVNLGTVGTGWQIQTPADLTGNGIADVVLWNQSTGVLGAWLLNGSGQVTGWDDLTTLAPSSYQIILGDFDGPGTADLGVLNTSTGQIGCWFISDGAISGGFHAMATLPSGWAVSSVGDFSGDGTDLLLTDSVTEQVGAWVVTMSSGKPAVTWDNIGTL